MPRLVSGLGEAASLLGDELAGFDLELAGELCVGVFPLLDLLTIELTLFSERSPSVGKSSAGVLGLGDDARLEA
jgi:hypothetical protein